MDTTSRVGDSLKTGTKLYRANVTLGEEECCISERCHRHRNTALFANARGISDSSNYFPPYDPAVSLFNAELNNCANTYRINVLSRSDITREKIYYERIGVRAQGLDV